MIIKTDKQRICQKLSGIEEVSEKPETIIFAP